MHRALPEHVRRRIALGQGPPRETPAGRAQAAAWRGLTGSPAGENIRPRGRSRLQAAWAEDLELRRRTGELVDVHEEAVRLRLADRTWLVPDFLVRTREGLVEFHEVKGHWEDDARAKLKVAAELHPWARFLAITRPRGQGWRVEVIPGPRDRRG